MSDAIVRLLFNTYDFDKNIKKAKGEIGNFETDIKGMASKAGSSIVKFAGTFGVAITAGEAFNKVLHSSQTLGDLTASTMHTAKESVDQFFYSLGAGEFNSFLSGLDQIISKAKDTYAAMDQLGNTKISHGYFSAKNEMQIQEAQYVAKNKFAPLEDRAAAFNQWKKALEQQEEINKTLQEELINTILKSIESEIGASNVKIGFEDVEMALKIDVTNPEKREELKEVYGRQYENYRAVREDLLAQRKGTLDEGRVAAINTQLAELDNTYREAIIVNAMLNKYTDEELQGIANLGEEYMKLSSSLASVSREYNESANEYNNANKAVKGFVAALSLEGYKTYLGTQANGGSGKVNKPKRPTDLQLASFNAEGWANEEAKGLHNKLRQAIESGDKIKIKNIEIDLDEVVDEAKLPDFSNKIDKNKDYAESLGYIGDAFGSMSSMADGAAGSILSYFGNLMTSVAAAIPAIDALNTKKKEESAANTETAVTGAASSVASIPFVGAALAVAAIASVLAALANVPKYATGGVIGGSSFFGDNMIARVNSGEMILNQSQQGKLFSMINNGGSSNHVTVDGEVSVKGKVMYIAIRNYMKANNIKW